MAKYLEEHIASLQKAAETNPELWKQVWKHSKLQQMFARFKTKAKKEKLPFNLNADNFTLPDKCPVLGIDLVFNTVAADFNSYSIDRVDNTKGYTEDNICIMSLRANVLKRDATLEELILVGKWAEMQLNLKPGRGIVS